MKNEFGPIGEMFRTLSSMSVSRQELAFLDMTLSIRFNHEPLGRYLCRSLVHWEEKSAGSNGTINCVIDYTDTVPHWRDILSERLLRTVVDDVFGKAQVFEAQDGYALLLDGFGAILRSAEGNIICLVDDVKGKRHSDDPCNLGMAAQIITASCLLQNGYLVVHAGGVVRNGRCHLWTGPSGIGKTTRVLELVSKGWDYCGDDTLILGKINSNTWTVFPYWRTARATPDTCARFRRLSTLANKEAICEKHVFEVDRFFSTKVPLSATLERIYCLGEGAALRQQRLSESEALERLVPCFLYYLWPRDADKVLASIWDIVSEVPVYVISRDTYNEDGASQ